MRVTPAGVTLVVVGEPTQDWQSSFSVGSAMRSSADHSSTFAECSEISAEYRKAQCVPAIRMASETIVLKNNTRLTRFCDPTKKKKVRWRHCQSGIGGPSVLCRTICRNAFVSSCILALNNRKSGMTCVFFHFQKTQKCAMLGAYFNSEINVQCVVRWFNE